MKKPINVCYFSGYLYANSVANKIREQGGQVAIEDIFSNFHGHKLTITLPTGKGSQTKCKEIYKIIDPVH